MSKEQLGKPVASSLPGEVPPEPQGGPPTPAPATEPTPEQQFKAWVISTTQRIENLEKAFNQDRQVLTKIDEGLEKLGAYRAPTEQAQRRGGFFDGLTMKDILGLGDQFGLTGGTGSMDDLYMNAGKKLVDGVVDTTVRKVMRELGGEVSHVVLKE